MLTVLSHFLVGFIAPILLFALPVVFISWGVDVPVWVRFNLMVFCIIPGVLVIMVGQAHELDWKFKKKTCGE